MDLSKLKEVANAKIDESATLLSSVSARLWQSPELALEEHKAHQMLTEVLEQAGFSVTRHFVLQTGFKAEFGSSPTGRPHVAVMCEYDALPGIGHACGHNLIAEVAVGAGLGLKAAIEAGAVGRVTVLGTPAEEGYGGKIDMIKSGFFNDVDVAVMSHPFKLTALDTKSLCRHSLLTTFTGKASHAAGSPWEGVNALDAAVTAYQSISNLRQQMRPDWRVHGIFVEGGQRPNIIPERAVLNYYIRCPTDKEVIQLRSKVEACFRAAALATGCQCHIELIGHPYSNVINNEPLLDLFRANLSSLREQFGDFTSEWSASTDMGNVSYAVPSIHPVFSVGADAILHTCEFMRLAGDAPAQSRALAQAKALAMTGLDIMMQPEQLARVQRYFNEDMDKYKCVKQARAIEVTARTK